MITREEADKQYYEFRAIIHAKRLSRETLESELARALVSLSAHNDKDALFGIITSPCPRKKEAI